MQFSWKIAMTPLALALLFTRAQAVPQDQSAAALPAPPSAVRGGSPTVPELRPGTDDQDYVIGAQDVLWSSRIDASYQARAHDSIGLFCRYPALETCCVKLSPESPANRTQKSDKPDCSMNTDLVLTPPSGPTIFSRIFVSASTHELSYTAPSFPMHSKSLAA